MLRAPPLQAHAEKTGIALRVPVSMNRSFRMRRMDVNDRRIDKCNTVALVIAIVAIAAPVIEYLVRGT